LIFLDADTLLEPMALRTVAEQFSRESATGTLKGCPDSNHLPYKLLYALKNFEHWSRFHAGSSGVILCWKRHFMKVGGFDERLEISENSHLMRRLMKFGRYKYISEVAATTSMRRYANRGFGRMVWLWVRLWFRSLFGELHNRSYETVR
jgi:predicted glycosyltransferase involved in capsule biosynthesis